MSRLFNSQYGACPSRNAYTSNENAEGEYDIVKSRLLDIQKSWRDEWHGFRIVSPVPIESPARCTTCLTIGLTAVYTQSRARTESRYRQCSSRPFARQYPDQTSRNSTPNVFNCSTRRSRSTSRLEQRSSFRNCFSWTNGRYSSFRYESRYY